MVDALSVEVLLVNETLVSRQRFDSHLRGWERNDGECKSYGISLVYLGVDWV